jgi:hypothetical protein
MKFEYEETEIDLVDHDEKGQEIDRQPLKTIDVSDFTKEDFEKIFDMVGE